MSQIQLTQFSHGGGCGCKISPALLSDILSRMPLANLPADLLVGTEHSDDAAVYRLNPTQAIVATTDFFMPIVNDPFDFGRIAATNALSDIYAMGATPLFALAIVGMPIDKLPVDTIGLILQGGESVCRAAGIPIVGGHSIDSQEPIYGLVAIGIVHPDQVLKNSGAQEGDLLILGKPLGVGILSAALKKGLLDAAGYAQMLDSTTRLNCVGSSLSGLPGVHAATDVTGFGLLGHLMEMCRGSKLQAQLQFAQVPLLPAARQWADAGVATGASERNLASLRQDLVLSDNLSQADIKLLCDPQTSGGLLVSCAPEAGDAVLDAFQRSGFAEAAIVGSFMAGNPKITVI